MRKARLRDAVLAAMGSRDEMPLDEVRAVVFATYREPELMRRGAYYNGKKSSLQAAYIAGEPVSDAGKRTLIRKGICKVLMDLRRNQSYVVFDNERQVIVRVRN